MSDLMEIANAARAEWLKATADGSVVQVALGIPDVPNRLAKPARKPRPRAPSAGAVVAAAAQVLPTLATFVTRAVAPAHAPATALAEIPQGKAEPKASRLALALRAPISAYVPLENPRCFRAVRECIPPGGGTRRFVIRTSNRDRTVHTYEAYRGEPPEKWGGILAIAFIKTTCPECETGEVIGDTVVAHYDVEAMDMETSSSLFTSTL